MVYLIDHLESRFNDCYIELCDNLNKVLQALGLNKLVFLPNCHQRLLKQVRSQAKDNDGQKLFSKKIQSLHSCEVGGSKAKLGSQESANEVFVVNWTWPKKSTESRPVLSQSNFVKMIQADAVFGDPLLSDVQERKLCLRHLQEQ